MKQPGFNGKYELFVVLCGSCVCVCVSIKLQGFFKMCCPGLKSGIIWTRGEFLQPNPVSSRLKNRWVKKESKHNNFAFKAMFYISAALVVMIQPYRAIYNNM